MIEVIVTVDEDLHSASVNVAHSTCEFSRASSESPIHQHQPVYAKQQANVPAISRTDSDRFCELGDGDRC